jgi:hypothetical protein
MWFAFHNPKFFAALRMTTKTTERDPFSFEFTQNDVLKGGFALGGIIFSTCRWDSGMAAMQFLKISVDTVVVLLKKTVWSDADRVLKYKLE